MHTVSTFKLGSEALLGEDAGCLAGRRVGLVSHSAAVNRHGTASAKLLYHAPEFTLTALYGPEHGFAGEAGAGELLPDSAHPEWKIPVFSLYGKTRKPTPAMLDPVDTLVVEFQDLGARPYTYVSTLRLVLEAAAEAGKAVIIADRPVPLPRGADGPVLDPAFESFVGLVPAPMQYGLTPGETARWLKDALALDLDLRIVPMQGYHRETERQPGWPPWIPPSPRIRSWEAACLFTATVFGEALPALDYGSGSDLSFQVVGAPWLDAARLRARLLDTGLPGLRLDPVRYEARSGLHAGKTIEGLRLVITDHARFRPVSAAVTILAAIQALHGLAPLWTAAGTREDWFDTLFGTDMVRHALKVGTPAPEITAAWQPALSAFEKVRASHMLYARP